MDLTRAASPCRTVTLGALHATDWTPYRCPPWAAVISVQNRGTGSLWVSVPALTGARSSTDDQVEVLPDTSFDLDFVGTSGVGYSPEIGIWGEDGAAHAGGLLLMAGRRR